MRSMLFVPGDRPERFAKALASGADAVICDLEDAVTPVTRPQARLNVADLLRTTGRSIPLWVRVNPVQTDDALPDLAAVAAARPDGIVLPKARSGADLHRLDHWLEALEEQHGLEYGSIKVLALITETANAVLSGASFTTPPARVIGYTWGAEDLAADVGASANRTADGEFEFTFRLARSCLLMLPPQGSLPTTRPTLNSAMSPRSSVGHRPPVATVSSANSRSIRHSSHQFTLRSRRPATR
jgi:citrate lyase subunit beta/citryl-CoA lyase